MPKGYTTPRNVICQICGSQFVTRHAQGKYCSPKCQREGWRGHWRNYNERVRDYRVESNRRRYAADPERTTARIDAYRKTERGALMERAHIAVWSAIAAAKLKKQPCEICGNPRTDGHHDDYSKPLAVTWLCRKHHAERHRMLRAAAAAE